MTTSPQERDVDSVSLVHDLDRPESFGLEVLDSEIAIHYKAEGWELA